jgi:hypothetical protein
MTRIQYFAALMFVAALAGTAGAQTFDLDWYTIDGGGALLSSGGGFELSGTIGQPDAGSLSQSMTSGQFELVGGFWPVAGACICPGDIDGDCQVALADLSQLLSSFGYCSGDVGFAPAADFDSSGCVDLADLSYLLSRFGVSCG